MQKKEDKMQKDDFQWKILDRSLSKYIAVWIWSILIGANGALTLSFITIRIDKYWGGLINIPISLMVFSISALLVSWVLLYRYLQRCLIPAFFNFSNEENDMDNINQESIKKINASYLSASLKFFIVGMVARLLFSFTDLILSNLR